jgi:Leucine-rich repeat (LRR) protein
MNVKRVDISYNNIKSISYEKIEYPKCKSLTIKGNKLEQFPTIISNVNTLEKLDLSENKISSMDDDVFNNLEDLVELDLSFNELTYLPSKFGQIN